MTPLFSNLSADGTTLKHHPGSVLSSAALIAGTTIGAGILALPAVTLPAGLLPSTLLMMASWLYMVFSGLLIAEVNLRAMRRSGNPELGLLSTIRRTLGKGGAIAAGIVYIFIHYALLVAYTARGGDILAEAIQSLFRRLGGAQSVPLWWGHVMFATLLGGVLFGSSRRFVGRLNNALVALAIGTFALLTGLMLTHLHPTYWQSQHWDAVGLVVPVLFVAFVYQNVVPVVTTQLEGDARKIRRAIWLGSLVPLVMFALWNAVILGTVSGLDMRIAGEAVDPLEMLRQGGWVQPGLGAAISAFSEFAIATSFIGFALGLLSVFEDILSPAFRANNGRLPAYALIFLPPLAFSVIDPNIFFDAIELAGAFGNSVLFGIIPALMAWKSRESHESSPEIMRFVPGGRGVLVGMVAIAAIIIVQNALIKIGILA